MNDNKDNESFSQVNKKKKKHRSQSIIWPSLQRSLKLKPFHGFRSTDRRKHRRTYKQKGKNPIKPLVDYEDT